MKYITCISGKWLPSGGVHVNEVRTGHICPKCGFHHEWSAYVYAHWDIALEHHCQCHTVTVLKSGVIKEIDGEPLFEDLNDFE
jgi:hypothetical protein